jgi:hypothetical protein
VVSLSNERKGNESRFEVIMQTRVLNCENVPPGNYIGVWSGYEVRVETGGSQYTLKTEDGIRGRAQASVSVSPSGAWVTTQ